MPLLDNAHPAAETRLAALGTLYDGISVRQLRHAWLAPGCRVLEVGAGDGELARKLASRPNDAKVTAVDIDTRWVSDDVRQRVDIIEADIADGVPGGPYDLIHARLVLMHLADRDAVLAQLVDALAPGGAIVVEELDPLHKYVPTPRRHADVLINEVGREFGRALSVAGADNARGWVGHEILARAGLTEVSNRGFITVATGGDPAAVLMRANVTQVRDQLIGFTDEQIAAYLQALMEPETTFLMPAFFSATGYRG